MKSISPREIIIHMSWALGIVSLLSIVLFAKDFSSIQDLDKIISFALSFASLILALIAIAQTLLSSASSNELYSSVFSAGDTIRDRSAVLSDVANDLKTSLSSIEQKIDEPATRLQLALEAMAQNALDIRGQAEEIAKNSEQIRSAAASRDVLPNNIIGVEGSTSTPFNPKGISRGQIAALYMCFKSLEQNVEFDPDKIIGDEDNNIYFATISTLNSFKIIEAQEIKTMVRVTGMKDLLPFRDSVNRLMDGYTNDYFVKMKENIDKYFHGRMDETASQGDVDVQPSDNKVTP